MEKLYYKISEVSQIMGETYATLRFWEKEFADYLKIHKVNGTRYYKKEDIEKLKDIQYLLRFLDYKIDGAKIKLSNNKRKITSKRDVAERLKSVRNELLAIRRHLNTTAFAQSVIID
ncbi:MAG: MerR family transcriptional regulator [Porphyromonadaceae bacterium]|nr:MerR family transcriptional regulator [Porphyromonadaceae bacterium]